MANIFISYRRSESDETARLIHKFLSEKFGASALFLDTSNIAPGDFFERAIQSELETARVVLAVIGKSWCYAANADGSLRLDDPHDFVRLEILTALAKGIKVVPVLVLGATIPNAIDLPPEFALIPTLNAFELREAFFEDDMAHLADYVRTCGFRDRNLPAVARVQAKVCMLGAAGVGKTSLVRRFVTSAFSESYITTLGVHISKTEIRVGTSAINVMLHDLAGEEAGQEVSIRHIRGASGLIIVADGRAASLDKARLLKERMRNELSPIPTVLAANKVDIYSSWQYPIETLETVGMTTFTTSAKTGKGVEAMFEHLGRKMLAL